jgi:hypothetical protein
MSRLPGIDFKFISAWTATRPCGSLSMIWQHQVFMLIAANGTSKEIRENRRDNDDFAGTSIKKRPALTDPKSLALPATGQSGSATMGIWTSGRKPGQSGAESAKRQKDLIGCQKNRPRTDFPARPGFQGWRLIPGLVGLSGERSFPF